MPVTECPLRCVPHDVWQLLDLSELYWAGLPPVAGGALDQAAGFVEAARFIRGEKNGWEEAALEKARRKSNR